MARGAYPEMYSGFARTFTPLALLQRSSAAGYVASLFKSVVPRQFDRAGAVIVGWYVLTRLEPLMILRLDPGMRKSAC